ncbi:hypothetical protein JQX13_08715 [Archangium violaceum]|uniref:putative metal-binding motif-containing protein n=1 Tax=Archangium violaceum TaxID=83451 RepID=UPI00193B0B6C|nr:putative metal-binding motif-containing protein [Archangium violaceum]QRK10161.1 hypothetical protein JQX13_08715 [Archangium violaceum]
MRRAWIIGCVLLLAACSNKVTDSAVALTITYRGYTPLCLRVTAEDAAAPERKSDEFIQRAKLASDEDRTLIVAVYREKKWSEQLQVEVASYATPDCSGAAIETRRLGSAVTLPAKGSVPATLELLAQDEDKDGHAATTGSDSAIRGTDCNDGDASVNPDARAVCDGKGSLNTDVNCDGKADCNGSACTGDEMCGSGHCVAGICCDTACDNPGTCQGAGSCGTGTCVYSITPNVSCNDENACTTGDKCSAEGVCQGTPKVCNAPPNSCYTTAGTCNAEKGGACEYAPLPATATCDDRNLCTDNDRCDGNGTCGGTPKMCNTPPNSCYVNTGTCNASTGACSYTPQPATVTCDDGKICTDNDKCDGNGTCAGTPKPCNTPPNQCYASPGACNTTSGVCEYGPLPNDSPCSDGRACTSDKCNGSGSCISTDYCPPPNECKTGGSCAADGSCQFTVDTTKVGKVCHEAGNTGTCLQDGTCQWFRYAVTNNFNPADIATHNTLEDLNIACSATFDSTARTWTTSGCSFVTPTPTTTSADYVVIPVRNLNVNAPLRVVGSRPVILAVYGDATLNNEIRANSVLSETQVGAGSGVRCDGRTGAQGFVTGDDGSGSGGGGFATKGGDGGTNEDGVTGGWGGGVAASGFSPLLGGCQGGDGVGPNPTTPGVGGAGGGSLQLSVAGRLTLRNVVTVSGAGGKGGTAANSKTASGGGGGSGGMLVLEADQVVVEAPAILTANGGGGGEGASIFGSTSYNGRNGSDGSTSGNTRALGGAGGGDYGGDGGQGAAGALSPTNGGNGRGDYGAGGGGGGAAGRILLRGVTSCSVDAVSLISPAYTKDGRCP